MVLKIEEVVDQRDRFLAFAFAASDLFLEVGENNRVLFSVGAVKGLTGLDGESLKGRIWTDIFSDADMPFLDRLVKNVTPGKRCGPILATIEDNAKQEDRKALVSAIKMPGKDAIYIVLGFPNALMNRLAQAERDYKEGSILLDKDSFVEASKQAMKVAKESGQEVDLTMFDMSGLDEMRGRVSEAHWDSMMDNLTSILKSRALDGNSVAKISDNSYGLLHDKAVGIDIIQDQVKTLLKESDPEGLGADIGSSSIDASSEALSEREMSRALMYSLNEFEKKGSDISIENLDEGFKGFVADSAKKIQEFKTMVTNLDFRLHFQPIVSLKDLEVSHYEMLTRFEGGGSPYEMITFGEDIGMAADFDMAVCKRAMTYIDKVLVGTVDKFAVNISGQSINNEQFFGDLNKMLVENKAIAKQLMFEITESSNIEDLDKVNRFIGILQKNGFKVALDDFGAGSASFQYLQKLHVDYVKLDGEYVQHMLGSNRNQTMIRSLSQLCGELNIKMVAERIETLEEAKMISSMNIGYGQGYLFSKPQAKPEYHPDRKLLKTLIK